MFRRKRDYHKKEYKNPLFSNEEKPQEYFKASALKWRQRVGIIILAITIICWLGVIFYAPHFKIKHININGLETIKEQGIKDLINSQLSKRRFFIFQQSNFWTFNKGLAVKTLNAKFGLRQLAIDKKFPNTLSISLRERVSALVWSANNKYYNLDLGGVAVSEIAFEKVNPRFPLIYDQNNQEVKTGQLVLSEATAAAVASIHDGISAKTPIKIGFFKMVGPKAQEIKVLTSDGWQIYFDVSGDIDKQINNLALTLQEKIKDNTMNLEYIDLRFGERVYYK